MNEQNIHIGEIKEKLGEEDKMEDTIDFKVKERKSGEKMERLRTDIPGFDELIEGGFPIGSVNVLAGIAGSAKSIWVENLAWNITNRGMKVLYINFEQPEWEIIEQGEQFGWDFSAMTEEGLLKFISVDARDLWSDEQIRDIEKQIVEGNYQVVILDSISSVYESPISSDQVLATSARYTPQAFMEARRAHMVYFLNRLKRLKVTVICTAQKVEGKPGDTTDNLIEFKGDSLTLFNFVEVGDDITRTVRIKKMRKTNIDGLTHPFEFTENGVVVKQKEV